LDRAAGDPGESRSERNIELPTIIRPGYKMIHPCFPRSLTVAAILVTRIGAFAGSPTEEAEFFEREIRPLLLENCGTCHGAEKSKAGLQVTSRKARMEGGESGPALVPGLPARSLLIEAVRQGDELRIPPGRRLRDDQIIALERWVAAGAPWPADPGVIDPVAEGHRSHWAFRPVHVPAVPSVRRADWCRTPIDHFVLARIEGGTVLGATDDLGFEAVPAPMSVDDLHATILQLLGFDHERLAYRYAGRDFRLTDVHGKVAKEILA
jgi:hypothetical protein